MPPWVKQGYEEYAIRMPNDCRLVLKQIDPPKRTRNYDKSKVIRQEEERILAAVPDSSYVVALDLAGKMWSTDDLSRALARWRRECKSVSLLVGGPDGLGERCKSTAQETWSLSNLTFPHSLVRILVAEQLYRAWSILSNHPYHK